VALEDHDVGVEVRGEEDVAGVGAVGLVVVGVLSFFVSTVYGTTACRISLTFTIASNRSLEDVDCGEVLRTI